MQSVARPVRCRCNRMQTRHLLGYMAGECPRCGEPYQAIHPGSATLIHEGRAVVVTVTMAPATETIEEPRPMRGAAD